LPMQCTAMVLLSVLSTSTTVLLLALDVGLLGVLDVLLYLLLSCYWL
jgi:hypothetical protein